MYDDSEDLTALTLAHFIIGRNLMVLPELNLTECRENSLKKWQRIQVSLQHVGTLVLVKHDSGPILDWKLGRIVKLYPGKDNICRVVDIKTRQGTIRRSVNQICALPANRLFNYRSLESSKREVLLDKCSIANGGLLMQQSQRCHSCGRRQLLTLHCSLSAEPAA
ncbi:hypothetical protein YQE_08947, partial [Dendroctonus ponderosae]